jgi:hypothetical protein
MITPSKKNGNDERMHLHRGPFRWPCGGVEAEAIHTALPDAAFQGYTGSHWMPSLVNYLLRIAPATAMATAKKKDVTCTHFDGRFDGHRDAAVLYRAHRPMEEVHGFIKSKPLNAAIG